MNKEIAKIKGKMVKLEGFFKDVAKEFRKEIHVENLYFLMENKKTGGFITKYSTCAGNPSFNDKELRILCSDDGNGLIFPELTFKYDNRSIIKRTLLTKIQWKIRFYKIHAILPIYFDDKIICLILFQRRSVESWSDGSYDFLKEIKKEIEYYLASILLYNQALDGVMKKCMALD